MRNRGLCLPAHALHGLTWHERRSALKLPPAPLDFFPPAQRAVALRHFFALAQTLRESAGERAGEDDDADEDAAADDDHDDADDDGRAAAREIDDAFALFTRGARITLADLRRVAGELREEGMDDATLRLMVEEATGERGGAAGVGREEFEGIMRRAGVFG